MYKNTKKYFSKVLLLKNRHQGATGVILANGPSALNYKCNNQRLIHIGVNASPLLEEKCNVVLDYYVLSDRRFLQNPEKRKIALSMLDRKTTCVLREELSYDLETFEDNVYFVKAIGRDGFSKNLAKGFYFGCTTTMLALQLAYYLGLRKIYLVGVDLLYRPEQPRFYHETNVEPHDPFTSVQIWNFSNAYLTLKELGVELYLCSYESLVRPYIPYKEISQIQ